MNFTIKKINKFNDSLDNLKIGCVENDITYKGIIFDSISNVVMTNFSHTQEFVVPTDIDSFCHSEEKKLKFYENITKNNRNSYKTYITEEGTLIRVFYHNNKWYISTQNTKKNLVRLIIF